MYVMKPIIMSEKDIARFWAKVAAPDPITGCSLWLAGTGEDGRYGRFQLKRKVVYAHRVALTLALGRQIKEDAWADHKCGVTLCMTLDHLHEASPKENAENRRGAQKSSTSGIRGGTGVENRGRWNVRVGHNRVRYFGGWFDDLEKAEKKAIQMRNDLFTNNLVDQASPVEA